MESFRKLYLTLILILPGAAMIGYIVYETVRFEVETSGFTRARVAYLETNEADTTGNTVVYVLADAEGKETSIVDELEDDSRLESEDAEPLFDERRVRFDPSAPTKVYFQNSWTGLSIGILFGGLFVFIGYTVMHRIPFFDKPHELYKVFAAVILLVIGAALLTDYITSLEKDNEFRFPYEYLAVAMLAVGGVLMYHWMQRHTRA